MTDTPQENIPISRLSLGPTAVAEADQVRLRDVHPQRLIPVKEMVIEPAGVTGAVIGADKSGAITRIPLTPACCTRGLVVEASDRGPYILRSSTRRSSVCHDESGLLYIDTQQSGNTPR